MSVPQVQTGATASSSVNQVTTGALKVQSTWGDYNNLLFVIRQALSKMQTATLVLVNACTNDGDVSPVGMVDIIPLVNQVDGSTPPNPMPHGIIPNVPYLRVQGGTNAIIMDPQPGDIGIAVFASRDITVVKKSKAQGNPGSARQYDFSDGLYLGGVLNGTPLQYIRFTDNGIEIISPQQVTITAPNIVLNGALAQSGGDVTMAQKLTVMGDVIGAGISLQTHTHTSEAPGTPTSEPIP